MNVERTVMAVAGLFVLASSILGYLHHPYWLFFTAFVGLNLFQAAFTGFCPMATILKKLGKTPGSIF